MRKHDELVMEGRSNKRNERRTDRVREEVNYRYAQHLIIIRSKVFCMRYSSVTTTVFFP